MTKSVDKVEHESTSKVQKEIEQFIIKEWGLSVPDKNKFGFQIDAWKKTGSEIKILAEIYASLGDLSPGGRKKILADMFKLISYVKVHDLKGVELQIILTSKEAADKLNSDSNYNSWVKEAIKKENLNIQILHFDQLCPELKDKLVAARARQAEGINKRKNEKL